MRYRRHSCVLYPERHNNIHEQPSVHCNQLQHSPCGTDETGFVCPEHFLVGIWKFNLIKGTDQNHFLIEQSSIQEREVHLQNESQIRITNIYLKNNIIKKTLCTSTDIKVN